MKAVIQRVTHASVTIENNVVAEIQKGLLVFVGIEETDSQDDIQWLVSKIANLRIFEDENQVMNLSVKDCAGEVLIVSQFTLHASTKKGNRPSYIKAAKPEIAIPVYEKFIAQMEFEIGKKVPTGRFGARRYGEQSEKESDKNKDLGEELADVVFVVLCLANQTGIDLQAAFDKKLDLKTNRDHDRHQNNAKLK